MFIAGQFVLAAEELRRSRSSTDRWRTPSASGASGNGMVEAVRGHGWDGDWFRRAYDASVAPWLADDEEGRIWIEPQGMCVMAGVGLDDGRAACPRRRGRAPRDAARPVLAPAYSRYHVELGEISSYPPGYKENGGVFSHTNRASRSPRRWRQRRPRVRALPTDQSLRAGRSPTSTDASPTCTRR